MAKKEADKVENIPLLNTNLGTEIVCKTDDKTEKELELLKELASYITQIAIPQLIKGLQTNLSSSLTDSKGISYAFHKHGVNLRYLGRVYNHELLKNHVDIKICLERVILTKSLKHLFKIAMRDCNIMHLNTILCNVLNAIFGKKHHITLLEEGNNHQEQMQETQNKDAKKKKKKKNK